MAKSNMEPELPNPVGESELAEEFKKTDEPFGVPYYTFYKIWFSITHLSALYFLVVELPAGNFPPLAWIPLMIFGYFTGLGVTVGTHRYWTHKTFKANKPLQIILMLLQTAAAQSSIFWWCRTHRAHHKYTDTDADPHNASRGFWYSHIGWLMTPRHPEVAKAFEIVELSDLTRDPIVKFQAKYYYELLFFTCFILPMALLKILFPEMAWTTIFAANMMRYIITIHASFLLNSASHLWGDKTYDKHIKPTDNTFVWLFGHGEGCHNYHHTFPWDYKSAEPHYYFNFSSDFIHFFAWLGWAWDLKMVNRKMLIERIKRTGDGSHPLIYKNENDETKTEQDERTSSSWGWSDRAITKEDLELTETVFGKSL